MNRQESLFAILPRAVKAAKEGGVQVTVVNDSRYASEGDGVHCYCPTAALAILYPYSSNFEAVVEKDGSVFFAKVEDVLESLRKHKGKFVRIEVEPEVFDKVAESLSEKKPICPNCGQWQHPKGDILDCVNDCAGRGFAPKVEATIWNSDGTDGAVKICAPPEGGAQ